MRSARCGLTWVVLEQHLRLPAAFALHHWEEHKKKALVLGAAAAVGRQLSIVGVVRRGGRHAMRSGLGGGCWLLLFVQEQMVAAPPARAHVLLVDTYTPGASGGDWP